MRAGENFCPGVLHAVPAKDGLLMRIRVPGGLIEAKQLKAVAKISSAFADDTIEITSRANLQLRAIRRCDLEQMIQQIASAGLLPSPLHDRVRNILTSPIAGLDPEEIADPRPLVHALDEGLRADPIFAELHPKFSFAVYGGPRRFSHDTDDLSLEAVNFNATTYYRFSVGGVASGFVVTSGDATACLLEAARMCIRFAKESSQPIRGKTMLAMPGAMERMLETLDPLLIPSQPPVAWPIIVDSLSGVSPARQHGRVNIVPSVPLGRLTAEQACCVAQAATAQQADLRLAAWRGVVLGSIPSGAASSVVGQLRSAGLPCDGRDGFQGIAACAGTSGCEASLADVRVDAASLARRLSCNATPAGWTVNLSGCEKQCGRRHGATAEMIAEPSGYILKLKGEVVACGCSSEFALNTISALHRDSVSQAGCR